MDDTITRNQILLALRARLELEAGMGIAYLSGNGLPSGWEENLREAPAANRKPPVVQRAAQPVCTAPLRPGPSARSVRPAAEPSPAPVQRKQAFATLVPRTDSPSSPEKEQALAPLRRQADTCQKCGLCERRLSVVWGEGCLDTRVLFIGEGPGRDEDEQGRPFVGRSGRLLTDIIEKGMKVPRSHVYITNVVKCRPPGNRDPKPEEVAACSEYLQAQIEVIQPKVIVAVGGVAGCALLGLPPRTSGLRGRWREYNGIPLRVIFHPSYLLRQRRSATDRTKADRDTWADIQEVMQRAEQ